MQICSARARGDAPVITLETRRYVRDRGINIAALLLTMSKHYRKTYGGCGYFA